MKIRITGSVIKLTGLSDGAIYAIEESIYGIEDGCEVKTTRTTATIPANELDDVIGGLKNHADYLRSDAIVDANVELSDGFMDAIVEKKARCPERLVKALKPYAKMLNDAGDALSPDDFTSVEGPQVIALEGKPTQVLAVGFGDKAIGDVTIIRFNGGVAQFLDGEWKAA